MCERRMGLTIVILLLCWGSAVLAEGFPCAAGVSLYEVPPLTEGDSPHTRVLPGIGGSRFRVRSKALAVITRAVVSRATIRRFRMDGAPRGLALPQPYQVTVELTEEEQKRLGAMLAGNDNPKIVVVCGGTVQDVAYPGHRLFHLLDVGTVATKAEARELALSSSDHIEEQKDYLEVSSGGVGKIRIGDDLAALVDALDTCSLRLPAGHWRANPARTKPLVVVEGTRGLRLFVGLGDRGTVDDILVEGGDAETTGGFRIGDDVEKILPRLGNVRVKAVNGRTVVFSDVEPGVALGLDVDASKTHLATRRQKKGQRSLTGRIQALWAYGHAQSGRKRSHIGFP